MLNTNNALDEFKDRVWSTWLPTYCAQKSGGGEYFVEGFKTETLDRLHPIDALDFIRAVDAGVVKHETGGVFRGAQSKAKEWVFTSARREPSPRPITLWLEPVITIAWVGRLHLDFGWPIENLGMQSKDWKFDLIAMQDPTDSRERIAGEIKKAAPEIDQMLAQMTALSQAPISPTTPSLALKNSHGKCVGLLNRQAPLFAALGPGRMSKVFKVDYLEPDRFSLRPATEESLRYVTSTSGQ